MMIIIIIDIGECVLCIHNTTNHSHGLYANDAHHLYSIHFLLFLFCLLLSLIIIIIMGNNKVFIQYNNHCVYDYVRSLNDLNDYMLFADSGRIVDLVYNFYFLVYFATIGGQFSEIQYDKNREKNHSPWLESSPLPAGNWKANDTVNTYYVDVLAFKFNLIIFSVRLFN